MDRQTLKDELIRDEGLRLKAYKDSVGLWTVGVGHLLGATQRMTEITHDEAMALFNWDLNYAESRARVLFLNFDEMSEKRQRALINMSFNLGGRLAHFVKFCSAVEAGQWETAAEEMERSKWWGQVGERASRLKEMILTG